MALYDSAILVLPTRRAFSIHTLFISPLELPPQHADIGNAIFIGFQDQDYTMKKLSMRLYQPLQQNGNLICFLGKPLLKGAKLYPAIRFALKH